MSAYGVIPGGPHADHFEPAHTVRTFMGRAVAYVGTETGGELVALVYTLADRRGPEWVLDHLRQLAAEATR